MPLVVEKFDVFAGDESDSATRQRQGADEVGVVAVLDAGHSVGELCPSTPTRTIRTSRLCWTTVSAVPVAGIHVNDRGSSGASAELRATSTVDTSRTLRRSLAS